MKNLNEKQAINILVEANLIEDVESVTYVHINESTNVAVIDSMEGEFVIYDNYDYATHDAIEQCKDIIDDCGLTDNLIDIAYIQGMIDESWFEDFWTEQHEFMAYEEGIEYVASEEELEQLDNGEIAEDEIRDNYFNSLQVSIEGSWMDEYKYQFGESVFYETLINNALIDIEELAQYCVDIDGVGHFLARYDGEEVEQDGYYIYRTN